MSPTNLISVVLLKEGWINQQPALDTPLFEESIYLIDLSMKDKPKAQLIAEIKERLKSSELCYYNEFGEEIQWRICKIIDIFDSIYDLKVSAFPNEVYSRHLALSPNMTVKDVLEKFYFDYIWEDE